MESLPQTTAPPDVSRTASQRDGPSVRHRGRLEGLADR